MRVLAGSCTQKSTPFHIFSFFMKTHMPAEDFKKCHRGYIVNLHAVKGLRRNSITLIDGREILVSTTYFQSVKDALIALRGGQ